ncbi:MAG: hypothetical protein IAE77_29915 [Prosthecobacter sp.]|jgi:hypothetical protein|uniref:hypothetical protein n=1 Tax=Prosthecobacter sp. TaxID=1965333 RepID=UPI0019DCF835|nr:hypothetical protein [Prosthecobacter sp.]MBE2287712.1 hypothetical protein [Prosthecobacter sp.]
MDTPLRVIKVIQELRSRIEAALKELLESKQLYQSVTVHTADLAEPVLAQNDSVVELMSPAGPIVRARYLNETERKAPTRVVKKILDSSWVLVVEQPAPTKPQRPQYPIESDKEPICFLPRIVRSCVKCDSVTAHLPGYFGASITEPLIALDLGMTSSKNRIQVFSFSYQCQVCREEPNVFLVRRQGAKLTLVGRSIFEKISVPKFVPEALRSLFSEALVASMAGKFLPACLYLRLVIEHHMRASVDVARLPNKPTGDELADEYSKVLHSEFPRSLCSFKTIYSDLSQVIHEGREDADVFKKSVDGISLHFDQLRLLPLSDWRALAIEASAQQPSSLESTTKPASRRRK